MSDQSSQSSTDDILQQARRLTRVMGMLREAQPNMPVQLAQTFLFVALNEGRSLRELAQITGAKQATISRHLLDLSVRDRRGRDGLQLVVRTQDPVDFRKNNYTLSANGRELVRRMADVLSSHKAG